MSSEVIERILSFQWTLHLVLFFSNNRLCLPSDPSAHCQAFCSLKVLALNSCDLTWPQVHLSLSVCAHLFITRVSLEMLTVTYLHSQEETNATDIYICIFLLVLKYLLYILVVCIYVCM